MDPGFGRSHSQCCSMLAGWQLILFQCSSDPSTMMGFVLSSNGYIVHWFRWLVIEVHIVPCLPVTEHTIRMIHLVFAAYLFSTLDWVFLQIEIHWRITTKSKNLLIFLALAALIGLEDTVGWYSSSKKVCAMKQELHQKEMVLECRSCSIFITSANSSSSNNVMSFLLQEISIPCKASTRHLFSRWINGNKNYCFIIQKTERISSL